MELNFETIAVGDWVWTEDGGTWGGRDRTIREVTKITKTQIVCDDGDEFDRYRRQNGYNISTYFRRARIVSVASPEEIETVGLPLKKRRTDENTRRAKSESMAASLPAGLKAWVDPQDVWTVEANLKGLTAEQVREVADLVKTFEPREAASV